MVVLDGRTSPIGSGAVQVHVQRLIRGRWVQSCTLTTSLGRAGRFAATLAHLTSGHYQAQASVLATRCGHGELRDGGIHGSDLRGADARLAQRGQPERARLVSLAG